MKLYYDAAYGLLFICAGLGIGYFDAYYAVELYKEQKVSLGYAAALAEMHKEEFIHFLANFNVSIFAFENKDEFTEEIGNA